MTTLRSPTARRNGILLLLLSSLCFSTGSTVAKIGLNADVHPISLLTMRYLLATFILWGVFAVICPAKLRIDRSGLGRCAEAAAAGVASAACFYFAITVIDVSVATVMVSLYPVVALLMLTRLGERLTRVHMLRLGLAMGGSYLLLGPSGEVNATGLLLVLGTAFFFALHVTLVQWRLSAYSPHTITVYITTFMALMTSVIYLFQIGEFPELSPTGWGVVLWTGIISTVVARFTMFAGIQHIGTGQMVLLDPVETLLAVLWAFMFLGERFSMLQGAGALLIVTSAAFVLRKESNRL
ncbi:MAG: DMT family transporter [Acidobacteria bacterium]|nr:DMT family transporter [Acidobacteriota bacterium]